MILRLLREKLKEFRPSKFPLELFKQAVKAGYYQMKPVKIFISYAHEDEEYKDQLVKQLSGLLRNGWIEEWNDRKIAPGQEWDDSIKNALVDAEVILFLVSADFMASDYIHDEEIKQALQRNKNGQLTIVPVIIRSCDFSSLSLSKFQALPTNATPIRSWDNRDAAWLNVVEGIKKLITKMRGEVPEVISTPLTTGTPTSSSDADVKIVLNDYHRFTCDRVKHNDAFKVIFKETQKNPAQFYYLYGGDLQSHIGLFNRISYDLEGRLQDYLNTKVSQSCKSLRIELSFELSDNLEFYKENILKSLFASFCIPVNDHEPLIQKDLAFAYQKSPNLKGLCHEDFVCIFISISEYDWDPEITPAATRWFINDFCKCTLPEDAPTFLFFFAIKYEEEDEEIKKEVESILSESENIQTIPELNMVSIRDIAKWLETYKLIAPGTRERKQLMKQHFGRGKEFYMEDLEIAFLKMIDEYNES